MGSILVLGGAGYIGSHTVYELISQGEDVVIVDNLETGFMEAVHPKAKFYQGDIRDRAFIDSVFENEEIKEILNSIKKDEIEHINILEDLKDKIEGIDDNEL